MDIEKIWQQHQPNTGELPEFTSVTQLRQSKNTSPLKKMRSILKINILWAIAIGVAYLLIICFDHHWQIRVLFCVLLLATTLGIGSALRLYNNIDVEVTAGNLLNELKRSQLALKKWIAVQSRMGLFLYPISAAAGFLFGGIVGSGKSVESFLSKPVVVIALVAVTAILTPLAHKATKWMFKRGFGKLQQHIDEAITELSAPGEG